MPAKAVYQVVRVKPFAGKPAPTKTVPGSTFPSPKIKPDKSRAGRGNEPVLADAARTEVIGTIRGQTIGAYVVSTIGGLAICTYVVSTIGGQTIGAYVVSTIGSLAICTDVISTIGGQTICAYVVSTISGLTICAYMVSTVSSDLSRVDMSRAVFCKGWKGE
ncbi:MAG: hypothetical protein JWP80_4675 [Pseudomonas sp.]|nr:hypothetical protein [Pseudomonas sp.]